MTSWSYNSADLLATMTYPSGNARQVGETITYNYLKQMALNTVLGSFPTTYVQHTPYDAAGRVRDRGFGMNGAMVTHYHYNLWTTQGGRLQQIRSGRLPHNLQG